MTVEALSNFSRAPNTPPSVLVCYILDPSYMADSLDWRYCKIYHWHSPRHDTCAEPLAAGVLPKRLLGVSSAQSDWHFTFRVPCSTIFESWAVFSQQRAVEPSLGARVKRWVVRVHCILLFALSFVYCLLYGVFIRCAYTVHLWSTKEAWWSVTLIGLKKVYWRDTQVDMRREREDHCPLSAFSAFSIPPQSWHVPAEAV